MLNIKASVAILFCCFLIQAPAQAQSVSPVLPLVANVPNQIPLPLQRLQPEATYSSVAQSAAIVVLDHARFTILTPQLIRMEWSGDGHFEDRPSLVFLNRRLPVPEFKVTHSEKSLNIETSALRLQYTPRDDGKFTPSDLTITLTGFRTTKNEPVVWQPGAVDSGNLQGTTPSLDRALGDKTTEPIEQGLLSRNGWALIDDSGRPLFDSDDFTFSQGGKSIWPWVKERPAGERQDWYFFGYGHNYRQVLADYVQVAGRIPLPPRFAFGVWWSRYWDYSDQELDELIRGFHENDVPLDVLVIDMGWHTSQAQLSAAHEVDQSGHRLGWSGYTWNSVLFPDPADFLAKIHREGLKITLNLHPASGVQPWEDQYSAMAKAMGQDPAEKNYVPFDLTNKKFAQNYMDILHHPLEKEGIDFWWLDWQQEKILSKGVNPTWWLNYVHFTDQQREGKRPLLFHRWGGLGNHRYQIGFSGDSISVWDSLAFQPWFTATAANVGYAYWSHDIGGHMPGAVDPELYTRWVQFGAFSPILRTHTTKNSDAERRVWAYPEPYSGILRSTFQLREALEPYIYTEARRTYDTGTAFLHPLYYDYPDAQEAYSSKDEYAFGDSMIVAPVTHPVDAVTQLAKQSIWVPAGDWFEWPTGKALNGPATYERSFSVSQEPIYLRSGAILPMQPPMQHTGDKPVDPLILNVWPLTDMHSSSYMLYEDGSDGESYKQGVYALTPVSAVQHGDTLTIEIAPVQGGYPSMLKSRSYELRLPADWPPDSVTVNGIALGLQTADAAAPGWHYEGNTLSTIVHSSSFPVSEAVHIDVRRAPGSLADRAILDGFPGSIARLRSAYDTLNQQFLTQWSPEPHVDSWPPDSLVDAWQTGDRISYRPDTARKELMAFSQKYANAQATVQQMLDSIATLNNGQVAEQFRKKLGHKDIQPANAQQLRTGLERTVAQLNNGNPSR